MRKKSRNQKKTKKRKSRKRKSRVYPNNILYLEDKKDCKKIYCGRERKLPKGYTDFGESYECLKKGFGAGKSMGEGIIVIRPNDLISLDLKGLRYIAKSKKIKKSRSLSKKSLIKKIIDKSHIC